MIKRGANINAAPQRGETALHWAAHHDHLDVVQMLVEHGADTSRLDDQRKAKPIEWAAEEGCDAVVEFLSRQD